MDRNENSAVQYHKRRAKRRAISAILPLIGIFSICAVGGKPLLIETAPTVTDTVETQKKDNVPSSKSEYGLVFSFSRPDYVTDELIKQTDAFTLDSAMPPKGFTRTVKAQPLSLALIPLFGLISLVCATEAYKEHRKAKKLAAPDHKI